MKFDCVYARVSTDEQAKDGKTSIDEQIEPCVQKLKSLEYRNIKIFREDFSGYEFDRPELDKIKELILAGQVRSLAFARVDRLTRKGGHLDRLREGYFVPFNVEVFSVNDLGKFEWTPTHKHLQNSLANFGELWGDLLKIVLETGRTGLVKRGNTMALGRAPLGYTEIKQEDGAAYFVADELEAKIVRMIFDYYVNKDMSTYGIAKELRDNAIPTYSQLRNGTPFLPDGKSEWHPTTVHHILTNDVYDGRWYYGKTKTVEVYDHELKKLVKRRVKNDDAIPVEVDRLVSSGTWKKAQVKLKSNSGGRKAYNQYLLSRRIVCHCGHGMLGEPQYRNRGGERRIYLYYKCAGMNEFVKGRCTQRVRTKLIDDIAWNWLVDILSNRDKLSDKAGNFIKDQEEEIEKLKIRLGATEQALEAEHQEHDAMLSSYLKLPELGQAKMITEIEKLEKKIKENTAEAENIKNELAQLTRKIESLKHFVNLYNDADNPDNYTGDEYLGDELVWEDDEDQNEIDKPSVDMKSAFLTASVAFIEGSKKFGHDYLPGVDVTELAAVLREEDKPLTFEEKQQILKEFDVTATLVDKEDGLYVHLVCSLDEKLCLLRSKEFLTIQKTQQYFISFSDVLKLDISTLQALQSV